MSKKTQAKDIASLAKANQALSTEVKSLAMKSVSSRRNVPAKQTVKAVKNAAKQVPRVRKSTGVKRVGQLNKKVDQRAVSEFEQVGMAMTVPAMCPPIRWNDDYSQSPTAVASPWAIQTAKFNTTSIASVLPPSDNVIFVFRSAECGYIQYDPNIASAHWDYVLYGSVPVATGIIGVTAPSVSYIQSFAAGIKTPLHHVYGTPQTPYKPHDNTWFAMADKVSERRYFFLGVGDSILCNGTPDVGTTTYAVIIDLWTPDAPVDNYSTLSSPMGGGTDVTFTATAAGYYAVNISCSAYDNITFAYTVITGDHGVFGHHCIPQYDNNAGATQGIRVVAASVMYTNQAAPINKQGKITAMQSPADSHWSDYISGNGFSKISASNGSKTMIADNGMYGFLKPDSLNNFDMQTYTTTDNGIITNVSRPLELGSAFLVLYVQINTPAGQDGYFTMCYGVEFQTTDVWKDVRNPSLAPVTFSEAIQYIKNVVQFHENPLHWGEIWSNIKAGAKTALDFVGTYGPPIINAASVIGKLIP